MYLLTYIHNVCMNMKPSMKVYLSADAYEKVRTNNYWGGSLDQQQRRRPTR